MDVPRCSYVAGILFILVVANPTNGEPKTTVRYYDQGDQTIRETRNVTREPVREIHYRTEQQTTYRPKPGSVRNVTDTYYVSVTKYRWETRWHNKWNLLQQPHLAYHAVPYTAWEPRQVTRQVVEASAGMVPETKTVRVPVPTLRFVERQNVTRVAVGSSNTRLAAVPQYDTAETRQPIYGGIARLDGDPPRYGAARTADDGWRARR